MAHLIKLDQLRPILKDCELYEGDMNIVIEGRKTKSQVVLPKENLPIVHLLNGENSVKEISSLLYNSHGSVSFHSIITTVKLLHEAGLLEDLEYDFKELRDEKSPHEQKPSILIRPLIDMKLWDKIKVPFQSDMCFYVLTAALVGVLMIQYQTLFQLNLARFLKSPLGYDESLVRLVMICSLLMTLKAGLQGLMLVFSAGKFYGPYLRVYPYAVALGINDNSLYSHPKKAVLITYGVMSSLLYLVAQALLGLVPNLAPYRNDLAITAILLTFIEMNPYRRSDLTKLFHFFYADNQLKSIMPYLKNCTLTGIWKDTGTKLSDEVRYVTYSVLAIGWAIGFSLFSLEVVLKSFPGLFYQIQLGQPQSKYSAMVVMGIFVFTTGYLFLDLFQTLVQNVMAPLIGPLMSLRAIGKSCQGDDIQLEAIKENFRKNMLFNQFSQDAIDYLMGNSQLRRMKKGASLILQGDSGRDVYFLVQGSVDVTVTEKTGRNKHLTTLGPNALIGEMAIFEKTKRTANVIAAEDILFIQLPEKIFSSLLKMKEFEEDCQKLKKRIEISHFVASANLFKDFPPEIMNVFVEAGDLVLFPAGHNVVDEGEEDKTFYLLIRGAVDVFKGNEKIAELGQGDFFGEVALIANVPRSATVKTTQDSLFLYIEDKDFWNILSQNIELAMYIESVGRHRLKEAA